MSREKFEEWYEKNNDFMINTQFVMEGNYYLDRHVRMAWLAWQEQQKVVDELKSKSEEALECLNDGNFNYCMDILEDILK